MLETAIYSAYTQAFLGDSAHRCRYCGGGPVMGGDGFLMDHCMNCGNWQSATEPLSLGFSAAKNRVVNLFKKATARLRRWVGTEQTNATEDAPTSVPCT